MRLFLAINLPSDIKRKISKQIDKLKKEYPYFRFVTEENYHITLHFFGEIANPDKIIKKINDAIYDISPFFLYSFEANLFQRGKITIYLGFQRNKVIEKLVDEIKENLGITHE